MNFRVVVTLLTAGLQLSISAEELPIKNLELKGFNYFESIKRFIDEDLLLDPRAIEEILGLHVYGWRPWKDEEASYEATNPGYPKRISASWGQWVGSPEFSSGYHLLVRLDAMAIDPNRPVPCLTYQDLITTFGRSHDRAATSPIRKLPTSPGHSVPYLRGEYAGESIWYSYTSPSTVHMVVDFGMRGCISSMTLIRSDK